MAPMKWSLPRGGGQDTPFPAEPATAPAPTGDELLAALLAGHPETLHAIRELARVEGEEPARMAVTLLREYLEQLNGGPLEAGN